jgi:hypothetical protein
MRKVKDRRAEPDALEEAGDFSYRRGDEAAGPGEA